MAVAHKENAKVENFTRGPTMDNRIAGETEIAHERWAHIHINWTAIWIGALTAFALLVVIGLIATALGAHLVGVEYRVVDVRKISIWTTVIGVCGAFFAAVAGGWAAVKIAGILHSEPAMVHGSIVWLLTVPMLVAASTFGVVGGWYAGLGANSAVAANAPFVRPDPLVVNATQAEIANYQLQHAEYNREVKLWREETPKVARNAALLAITALLIGLIGSVLGGWMGSGEPMNFSHYHTREPRFRTV
jgi:uncharacterized membrane protein